MKKQAILIYDPESKELIAVSDVRFFDSDKFESLSKEANKNLKAILKKHDEEERAKETKRMQHVDRLYLSLKNEIYNLQHAIAHLLGYEEFDEDQLREFINCHEEKTEQESEEPEFVGTEESEAEPHE